MTSAKVAISLPPELLRWIDLRCSEEGISRSEFIRNAVDHLARLRSEQEQDLIYAEGYAREPETLEDLALPPDSVARVFSAEPWG